VVSSGIWNFFGVRSSTGAVAYGIVALLPPVLVLNVASGTGAAALLALLLAAVGPHRRVRLRRHRGAIFRNAASYVFTINTRKLVFTG
jgi:hypothetical protein